MKKIVLLALTAAMLISVTGCESKNSSSGDSSSKSEESSVVEVSSSEESTSEAESSETSTSKTEAQSDSANADVKDAIEGTATTDEKAADIGQWVKTSTYSATDKVYHTIYVRVTKVATKSKDSAYVDDAIKLNNELSSDYGKIDVSKIKIPSDAELCVMDYEVYIPSDFPTQEWGIVSPNISFGVSNIGGGGIPSADGTTTYIGMGTMSGLKTQKETKYQVGNTYSFRNLYIMVKGYEDYVFDYREYPDGTKSDEISGKDNSVYHKAF